MSGTRRSISHVYTQTGKDPARLQRNGIVWTNLEPSEQWSRRRASFYLWLRGPTRHARNRSKPISGEGTAHCGRGWYVQWGPVGQGGKILENDLLRWLTQRGLVCVALMEKLVGSQEFVRSYQPLLGRSILKVETCMCLNGRGWVHKKRSLFWEDRGLSGILSLTYPQYCSALTSEW